MTFIRRRLLAVAALVAAMAICAPLASAGAAVGPLGFPAGTFAAAYPAAPAGCVGPYGPSGVGDAGATESQACGGTVVAFIGPAIGQVASAMGPTVIGSVVNAPITVTNAPVGGVAP